MLVKTGPGRERAGEEPTECPGIAAHTSSYDVVCMHIYTYGSDVTVPRPCCKT